VCGIFVVLLEALGAESLELLTSVLFAFGGSVVVAESTLYC
jgi:hypothetical protein